MKKLVVLTLSLLVSGVIFAQKEPKGSPGKAESYLTKNDLENAKAEIDKAITLEKQAGKSGTWFTRGKVYQAIATQGGDDSAIPVAMEAYAKVKEIDPNGSQAKLLDIQNIAQFQGFYFNKASEGYNAEDYTTALNNFKKALQIIPNDSLTLYYGSLAAYQNDDYNSQLEMYLGMMEYGYADREIYSNAIYTAKESLGDNEKAMTVIKKGQEAYPEHAQFRYDEINIYLEEGKDQEALAELTSALEKDPDNYTLHLQLGLFKDNIAYNSMTAKDWDAARAKYAEAQGHYEEALRITENDNFVANFNLGVIYVNLAKEHYDTVRDMDIATYNKSGKEVLAKGNEIISKAIPYIQKATELEPKDVEAWKALQQIYTQLKMNDKAEEAFNMVEKLEAEAQGGE